MARKYELKRRAERQEETRQRIVDAVVDLHASVGPAKTTVSAVAEQAGVERLTVYRHFPDERALVSACASHWSAEHPAPDPEAWRAVADPEVRLRRALTELYAYYRDGEAMLANIYRDAPDIPAFTPIVARIAARRERMVAVLSEGWDVDGGESTMLRAALGHAIDFTAWRSLTDGHEVTDEQAITLMVGMVEGAMAVRPSPS